MKIKNIIFDLGGVIIDIDYNKTSQAFHSLGAQDFDKVYSQSKQTSLFDDFETGGINASTFRQALKCELDIDVSDNEFDQAWNAMLLDLPIERLDFIHSLRSQYRVFLFSNTNAIHLPAVYKICKTQNGTDNLAGYFEKEYYSHTFGLKKPSPEAFLSLLKENDLQSNETLFVDDSYQHILGAREAGLHAVHLTNNMSIFETLNFISEIESTNQPTQDKMVSGFK